MSDAGDPAYPLFTRCRPHPGGDHPAPGRAGAKLLRSPAREGGGRGFGPNRGDVFNSIHNIQARAPVEKIAAAIDTVHEFNGGEQGIMTRFEKLYAAILKGDDAAAVEIVREALGEGVDPADLIDQGMIPAMREAGQRFEDEEFFVPELLLAARAMKAGLELIRPLLAERGTERKGCMVIGTVRGDLHDIGKNLVSSMLEGAGFEVVDLGADVAPELFVEAVKENDANLLGLSALLTVTMTAMKATIDALEEAGLRDRVKVLVGGAPLSAEYASEIGADGYASNASAAVRVAQECVGG